MPPPPTGAASGTGAGVPFTIGSKEELDILRDISSELRNIVDLDSKAAKAALAGANVEREILNNAEHKSKFSEEELEARLKISDVEQDILKTLTKGGKPALEKLQNYIREKKVLDDILRAEKERLQRNKEIHGRIDAMAGKAGLGKLVEISNTIGELWRKHPIVLGFTLLVELTKMLVDTFDELDKGAFKFRQEMGVTRDNARESTKFIQESAISMARLGVTAEIAADAAVAFHRTTYGLQPTVNELGKSFALIQAQLGISSATTAEFTRNLAMAGRSTQLMQKDTMLFAFALAGAAQVPVKDVMEDVSNYSKNFYQFIRRGSLELIKAAVEARRMGTSLQNVGQSSKGLLDFTTSIESEMQASVLLGESMNLTRLRTLAYEGDTLGVVKEQLRLIEKHNLLKRDPITMAASAKALNLTEEAMAKMAQASEEQRNIQRAIAKDPALREQQRKLKEMQAATADTAKNYAKIAATQLTMEGNQTRINNISNSWREIKMQLAKVFLPVIEGILKFIADNLKSVLGVSTAVYVTWKMMTGWVMKISKGWGLTTTGMRAFGLYTRQAGWYISQLVKSLGPVFSNIGTMIRGIFTGVGARLMPFLRSIGPWIVRGLASIGPWLASFFSGLGTSIVAFFTTTVAGAAAAIVAAFAAGFGVGMLLDKLKPIQAAAQWVWLLLFKIWDGIVSVSEAIWKTLVGAFDKAWNGIKDWLGFSPSKLGLTIVEGLKAVGSMLFNALVSPFKMAWEYIKNMPLIGGVFKKLMPDTLAVTPEVAARGGAAGVPSGFAGQPMGGLSNKEVIDKLNEVVVSLDKMRDDFAAGKLRATVNIDAMKVDSALGRSLEFRGIEGSR